jgi:diaminohydroxyphosphoribosylaminopyrimidine deaminase / 5-amino-6-(5-phosphoribosylamino)uracil reductase
MRRALDLARQGWGHTAPNPLVGAVIVRDDTIVGEGYHASYGGPHAETQALRAADAQAQGATVYVTLEPCAHTGHTPPCADALIRAGVHRVVVAVPDPHPVARGGIDRLKAAGVTVTVGVETAAARELNAPFFHALESDRPWVTLKLAVSLDGAVADGARSRGRFTGDEALQAVHHMRAGHDAIAVGIGTALADDPLLTVRYADQPRTPPVRVVFDREARLPLESHLVRTVSEAPVIVVTARPSQARASQLAAAGVSVLVAPTIGDALVRLRERGVRSLLLEGGPRLAGGFLAASAVNRLVIFQAPLILGGRALPALAFAPEATVGSARRLPVLERRPMGDDIMTVFAISDS